MLKAPIDKHTFRHGGNHCRHCGDTHTKGVRYANHKNLEALKADVFEILKAGVARDLIHFGMVQREPLSHYFKVPEHQIEHCFQLLKQEGFLGTASNEPPHDSTRDRWGGSDSAWMGSWWPVREDKFREIIAAETPPARRMTERPKNKF